MMERVATNIDDVKTVLFGIYSEYKDDLKDAKEWGDAEMVRSAYHDVFVIENVLNKLGFGEY